MYMVTYGLFPIFTYELIGASSTIGSLYDDNKPFAEQILISEERIRDMFECIFSSVIHWY